MTIPLKVTLALECIGDDIAQAMKAKVQVPTLKAWRMGKQPWVAEITGTHPTYGFQRQFIYGQKDYSQGNSVGSRGVYRYYQLEPGKLYEVFSRATWNRSERYFCQVADGALVKMTIEEVYTCLSDRLASTSMMLPDSESA
jgi:hypothetical protein